MVNHYALLGVPDNATQQQIWQAYQDIHLENGGNGRKRDNRLIANAIAQLGDPGSQQEYDEFLEDSDKQLDFAARGRRNNPNAQAVGGRFQEKVRPLPLDRCLIIALV
ncbi:MAG: hypothetical protein L6R41_002580 [Letrouitia leprolyta]|nr:MAG: hypothetical protein L6R41_002580 [Letrouitia leprolyta]